jgi:hypothetical protein
MVEQGKMKRILVFSMACLLCLSFALPLLAQDRAAMSAPVIRPTPEGVTISAQFSNFASGGEYRLGIATVEGAPLKAAQIELIKGEQRLPQNPVDFDQGHTSGWWQVNKVSTRGFFLKGNDLPTNDEKLTLRVTIPKEEIKKHDKVFLLVARKYGETVWYLEDGQDVDKSYW